MTSHAAVLERKSKVFRPITGQDSHLGFVIASKRCNTSSGFIEEQLFDV
jgi:hypothetical protein